jgi:hypothetical protein
MRGGRVLATTILRLATPAAAMAAMTTTTTTTMIPATVRARLPGLYRAPLALVDTTTRNAITNELEVTETMGTTPVLDGLAFLVRRPG